MRQIVRLLGIALLLMLIAGAPALAQTFNSGSTGADGAFNPTAATTLTLPPDGVFNFTTITIPSGVTVKFARNSSNTPVTLLASGNVTINGIIDVSGANGGAALIGATAVSGNGGLGGVGGFDGGNGATGFISTTGGSGQGPGGSGGSIGQPFALGGGAGGAGSLVAGATGAGTGAGVGGPAYGTPSELPLIGGSGGGGGGALSPNTGSGGGGGGGAILIASSGTLTFGTSAQILAQGGAGGTIPNWGGIASGAGGSGGSVRLVATSVTGSGGSINISGGSDGFNSGSSSAGRLRVEGFSNTLSTALPGNLPAGAATTAAPTTVTLVNGPTIRIASVAGVAAPAVPTGSLTVPDVVLPGGTTSPVTVNLSAANIPLGTVITVTAKGQFGAAISATSGPLAGTVAASTAAVSIGIATDQSSVISASASFTIVASAGGPVFVEGEEVDRVRVTASYGGPAQVAYVTKSGRAVVVAGE
jgi:hypothetical protein